MYLIVEMFIKFEIGEKTMKKAMIMLSSLFMLTGVSTVSANDNTKRVNEIKTQIKELQKELKELEGDDSKSEAHKVGDEVTIGDYVVKIVSVSYEYNPDKTLLLEFEVTNNSEEDFTYTGIDFRVYIDGKEMEALPLISLPFGDINPGRTVTGKVSFGIKAEGKLEIEWEPRSYDDDTLHALWKIDDIAE
ncbi:DUF5067 domain-containing protein [Aerococcaceae bacterium zg-B36]|uniref:DUF5067 domain-containing protein n=1 Tax=Aerococcaceae bacterium zg-252 TaxID=2796928 RepID=UPI001BD850E7|nr:DUF5067 domain-containing protein [Aerococcaceae bacterium zg-B36]